VRRLQGDDQFSAAGEKLKMKYIWKSLFDWKTWLASTPDLSFAFWIISNYHSDHIHGL
jgi:hypothetical protein